MASAQDESCFSHYRKLLIKLSLALSSKDLEMLTFAAVDFIPRGRIENIRTGLHFFDVLEQDTRIGPRNMALLQDMFRAIGRVDLARRIQAYLTRSVKVESDGKNICQICSVVFSLWMVAQWGGEGRGGGSLSRFTNKKDGRSRITDIKIFPESRK